MIWCKIPDYRKKIPNPGNTPFAPKLPTKKEARVASFFVGS
jgi:hypothetical protein